MSADPQPGGQRCMRCLGPLPEGVHFCVACGFSNDAAVYGKMAGNVAQTQQRQERMRAMINAPRWLRWLFFWRM